MKNILLESILFFRDSLVVPANRFAYKYIVNYNVNMHVGTVEIQIYCFYFNSCSVFSALYNMNSMCFKRSSALLLCSLEGKFTDRCIRYYIKKEDMETNMTVSALEKLITSWKRHTCKNILGGICLNKNVRPLEFGKVTLHKRGDVYVNPKDKCCARQKSCHVQSTELWQIYSWSMLQLNRAAIGENF